MSFRKLLGISAVAAAIVIPAAAQSQSTVTVDGKQYVVTEMQGGPSGHLVSLSGPEGTAMIMVDGNRAIKAIISPPGGQLNGVDYAPGIREVWNEYTHPKAGTPANDGAAGAPAAPAGQEPAGRTAALSGAPAGAPSNPNAAVASLGISANGAKVPWSVTFTEAGEAVAKRGAVKQIRFTPDATKAYVTDHAVSGDRTMLAEYEGGGASLGKGAKTLGGALIHGGTGRISANNDAWELRASDGSKLSETSGVYAGMTRDGANNYMGLQLNDVFEALQAANAEAAKQKTSGNSVTFKPDQKAYDALEKYYDKNAPKYQP